MNANDQVRSLDEEVPASEFGGKAAALATLRQHNYPVPPGVCISSLAYLHAAAAVGVADSEPGVDFAERRDALMTSQVPHDVIGAVISGLAGAGVPQSAKVIVRSSAVGEDSGEKSFAGQLDTVSDVAIDGDSLSEAIARVWASAWGSRAEQYRRTHQLTRLDQLPVGVVVQAFVEPDHAGVMFTASPFGSVDDVIIEAVEGRGEGLVSGAVTPAHYTLRRGIGPLDPILESGPELALSGALLTDLVEIGLALEQLMGEPQDVEWVVAGGTLQIVQTRPITTRAAGAPCLATDDLVLELVVVTADNRDRLPDELLHKDKFRLRLVATAAGAKISRGWLLSVRRGSKGMSAEECAEVIAQEVEVSDQVSLVLQDPPRLEGDIVRQFSPLRELSDWVEKLTRRVGGHFESFDFIVTEIYKAEKSGIAHIVDGRLVVEVAYGSYVPKGIVPTSLYVSLADGSIERSQGVLQATGVFIESGVPVTREVNTVTTLDESQLRDIWHLTAAVAASYPDVSVEFGVLGSGEPYLIDIIPDMAPVNIDDVRVMSPGVITGRILLVDSEAFLTKSLDAHFHSERSGESASAEAVVVVAPTPFLALEEYLTEHGSSGIGFVFEAGSLLGHLAIILREHQVPAIVVPEIRSLVSGSELVTIDSSAETLLSIEG